MHVPQRVVQPHFQAGFAEGIDKGAHDIGAARRVLDGVFRVPAWPETKAVVVFGGEEVNEHAVPQSLPGALGVGRGGCGVGGLAYGGCWFWLCHVGHHFLFR